MSEQFPADMLPSIEEFFKGPARNLKSDQTLYDEVFDTGWFFPLQRKKELRKMMEIAQSVKPQVVMEIGTDKGGGLFHWCKCNENTLKRVIASEIKGTPYSKLFEKYFPKIEFLWLTDSLDVRTVKLVEEWLGVDRLDCLFIDGDKSAFLRDFNQYYPYTRKGSVVFMHDIQDDAPGGAFKEVEKSPSYTTYRVIDTTEYFEIKDREPRNSYEGWLKHWHGRSAGVGVIEG